MYLQKFVKTHTGKYIMSILLGIGLATIFRSVCKGKECSIYMAPPLDEIEDKIYKFDGKCYKFERVSKKCDSSKKIVEFA
jgi:hypothetical protein